MRISKISFKGDDDIFKKTDFKSKEWVQSDTNQFNWFEIRKLISTSYLDDTFERIKNGEEISDITEPIREME